MRYLQRSLKRLCQVGRFSYLPLMFSILELLAICKGRAIFEEKGACACKTRNAIAWVGRRSGLCLPWRIEWGRFGSVNHVRIVLRRISRKKWDFVSVSSNAIRSVPLSWTSRMAFVFFFPHGTVATSLCKDPRLCTFRLAFLLHACHAQLHPFHGFVPRGDRVRLASPCESPCTSLVFFFFSFHPRARLAILCGVRVHLHVFHLVHVVFFLPRAIRGGGGHGPPSHTPPRSCTLLCVPLIPVSRPSSCTPCTLIFAWRWRIAIGTSTRIGTTHVRRAFCSRWSCFGACRSDVRGRGRT